MRIVSGIHDCKWFLGISAVAAGRGRQNTIRPTVVFSDKNTIVLKCRNSVVPRVCSIIEESLKCLIHSKKILRSLKLLEKFLIVSCSPWQLHLLRIVPYYYIWLGMFYLGLESRVSTECVIYAVFHYSIGGVHLFCTSVKTCCSDSYDKVCNLVFENTKSSSESLKSTYVFCFNCSVKP